MGFRVATNLPSMQAVHAARRINDDTEKTLLRASSGDRIYMAAYDPAGLAISEGLKSSIRSFRQAQRNANDGITLMQVAEGAISVMSEMGIRMRELAMQAATDTITDSERSMIEKEFSSLKSEIQRFSQSTEFNGHKLLNGKTATLDFQIGIRGTAENNRLQFDPKKIVTTLQSLNIDQVRVITKEMAQEALSPLLNMVDKLNQSRTELGSLSKRMESTIQNLQISDENASSGNSRIRDADIAVESANRAVLTIREKATTAILANANSKPAIIKDLI